VATQPLSNPLPEIPGYRMDGLIGRGATGVVYRATQLAVDRPVAIKVLHPELCARKKAVHRLQREARTTARLAHPGIVGAIDMGRVGGLWWYAMELVEGPSLAALLEEQGRLSERKALRLFIPLCEALQHASEAGVVHRDIKPANILIDKSGRARLVDLGLAFTENDPLLTKSGGTLGTPHYVSPEQARQPESADVRSDIWSLGATLYHALCGRPPFSGESVAEILSGVLYARVPDPQEVEPTISRSMSLVLRKCLARQPQSRYQHPRDLAADLERIRERRPVEVQRSLLDPISRQRDPLRRGLVVVGTLLGVALAVALVAWRPWNSPSDTGNDATAQEVYEPFVPIRELIAHRKWALALADLEGQENAVPRRHQEAYEDLVVAARRGWFGAIDDYGRRMKAEFDRLERERDFIGAARILSDTSLRRDLGGVLWQSLEQEQKVLARLDLASPRAELEREQEQALEDMLGLYRKHYNEVVRPRVDELIAAGRWEDARAELQKDPGRNMPTSLANLKLPAEAIEHKVLATVRGMAEAWLLERDQRWRELDLELEAFVDRTHEQLAERLRNRSNLEGAGERLKQLYAERLQQPGSRVVQVPAVVADRAQARLERRVGDLEGLERALLEEDARVEWTRLQASRQAQWRERRYEELIELWSRDLEQDWLSSVHERIALEVLEAELLQGLLQRAAAALPQAKSILIGTIRRDLRQSEIPSDPLLRGFRIKTAASDDLFRLRAGTSDPDSAQLLKAESIEDLAGIAQDPALIEARDRLLRALLRDREGDAREAARTYDSGPLPGGELGELAQALGRRVNLSKRQLEEQRTSRLNEAQIAYNSIARRASEETVVREPDDVVRRINALLADYSDLEFVQQREKGLRAIKEQLETPAQTTPRGELERIFAPTELRLSAPGRARMVFDFASTSVGRWEPGDWKLHGSGWTGDYLQRGDLLRERIWPRLLLTKPLDLKGYIGVEFAIEQPYGSGDPRALLVSVAGWHVLIERSEGQKSRLHIGADGSQGLRELLEAATKPGAGKQIDGPRRGERHTLRIELSQSRQKITVLLDGKELIIKDGTRPTNAGSHSVVVRSIEPVLLQQVTVEAEFKP
jgi:tRNA A-37 threonylcarbamoyl transferase component Bud32